MIDKRKKLSLEYPNKVKYEKLNEFDESIFSKVYYNACRCVRTIIGENEKEGEIPDKEYSTEEQLNNIVAFLGERGRGKSSAMLSFALFLKRYKKEDVGKYLVHTEKTNPVFSVLPRIDVAMMISGESIMDIILAQMWDSFEKRSEEIYERKLYLEEVKEDFRNIRHTYEIYKSTVEGRDSMQHMTSVRQLHELAACLNLRAEFKNLINDYLGYMLGESIGQGNSFLVVSIDDLDMAVGDVYAILEQIRLFMSLPKVIVLVTADMERLGLICRKRFADTMHFGDKAEEQYKINSYVMNYLAKLFPGSVRILLPGLGKLLGVDYEIDMKSYMDKIYSEPEGLKAYFQEKELLLVLMIKFSDIIYPNHTERFFLQKNSLRKTVNNLNILLEILELEEEEGGSQIIEWYYKEMSDYLEGIYDVNTRLRLSELLNTDYDNFEMSIYNTLGMFSKKISPKYGAVSYGDILFALDCIKKEENKVDVYEFCALLYSIYLGKLKSQTKIQNHFGTTLFYEMLKEKNWEDNIYTEREFIFASEILNIKLNYSNIQEEQAFINDILNDDNNCQQIISIMNMSYIIGGSTLYYADNQFPFEWRFQKVISDTTKDIPEGNKISQNQITDEILTIEGKMLYTERKTFISVDNLFFLAPNYEEYINIFCEKLYQGLSDFWKKNTGNHNNDTVADGSFIKEKIDWNLDNYLVWKNKYNISSVADILPLQSVDLMYTIADDLRKNVTPDYLRRSINGSVLTLLMQSYEYIVERLGEIEKQYIYDRIKDKVSYSNILLEFLDIIQLDRKSGHKRAVELDNIVITEENNIADIDDLDDLDDVDDLFDLDDVDDLFDLDDVDDLFDLDDTEDSYNAENKVDCISRG